MISFGALVAFSAVNLAVIRSTCSIAGSVSRAICCAPADRLRPDRIALDEPVSPDPGHRRRLVPIGMAYLAAQTGGFPRTAPQVRFSEIRMNSMIR
jgi:hypothetical protein